jgi:hypothetical protein
VSDLPLDVVPALLAVFAGQIVELDLRPVQLFDPEERKTKLMETW